MDKQLILLEIKRLTQANNGTAPGRKAFQDKSGIKESDWLKYWAKWSDAVEEAGFIPNEFNRGYDNVFLIGKLIELTRELGHFPSSQEIRFKSYNDSSFPNKNTFGRLGNLREKIEIILNYCQNKEHLSDIIEILAAKHATLVPQSDKICLDNRSEAESDGYIYLAKSGRFFKIGRTYALGRREYELAIQLPEKLTTIHVIRTDDPVGIEKYWHSRFYEKRKNGEWFELTTADINAFKRRSFM